MPSPNSQDGRHRERRSPNRWGPDADDLVDLLAEHGIVGSNIRQALPAETARQLLLRADHLSFLPRLAVAEDLASGAAVALSITDLPTWTCDVAIAYRERKNPDAALSLLHEAVAATSWPA